MVLSDHRKQLLRIIYEKLIIAIFVAACSALFVYSYNVYSKAFELAESHARNYSSIAEKLKNLTLDSTIVARQGIRSFYNKGARNLPNDEADTLDALGIQIRGLTVLVKERTPQTARIANEIADVLEGASVSFVLPGSFTKAAVEEKDRTLVNLQESFIKVYGSEVGQLAADEYQSYLERFELQLPFYLRPAPLLTSIVFILVFGSIAVFLFE